MNIWWHLATKDDGGFVGPVRVRFSTCRWSIVSALIRWHTDSQFSHVEFELPGGATLGSRFSLRGKLARCFGWNFWRDLDGVQVRPPTANRRQTLVAYKTFPKIEDAAIWGYKNRVDSPYDLLGILGIVSATGWAESHDDFCSEFVTECANAVYVIPQNNPAHKTVPDHLYISTAFKDCQ